MAKTRPFEVVHFPVQFPDPSGEVNVVQKVAAMIADKTDEMLVNTIKECARKEGITQLYLLDKRFIVNALKDAIKKWEDEHGTEKSN